MKNILKFGLLTRFVMLFLFIFGIHAFTPTVALAGGDATIINYNGGVCSSPNWIGDIDREYAPGDTITFLTPTCDGYTFTGYEYTDTCIYYDDPQSISASNLTLDQEYANFITSDGCSIAATAQWEAVATAPTITLINTGATTARIDSLYYNENRFYTDAKFRSEISASDAMTIPVRKYKVTYDAQSGTVSPTSASAQYTFDGYTVTIKDVEYEVINSDGKLVSKNSRYLLQAMQQGLPATVKWTGTPSVTLPMPTRTGHTFKGWHTSATGGSFAGNAGANYTASSDITLHAQWEANQYIISYACGNGSGTAPSQTTCDVGTECLLAKSTCAAPKGYMFSGWKIGDNTIDNFTDINTVLSAGTYTATAQYEKIEPEFTMTVYPINLLTGNTQVFGLSGVQGTFLFDCGNGESFAFFASDDTSSITPACKYSQYKQEYEIKIASVDDPTITKSSPSTFRTRTSDITKTTNSLITKLDGSLGKLFNNNNLSIGFASAFSNATKLTDISPTLLDGFSKLYSVTTMFYTNTSLTNIPLNLLTPKEGCITYVSSIGATQMFSGSTKLSSVTDWDGNVTDYLPASLYERLNSCETAGAFKHAFSDTALADTCPAGTYEVGKIGGKPACAPCPANSSSEAGATECTCNTGYNYNGATTTTTEACVANVYTITLNMNGGDANGAPGQIYEKPNDGWYDEHLTQTIDNIGRLPIKDKYVFNGFFTEQNGTGTQVIASDGRIIAPNFLFNSDATIYAYYTNCECTPGDGVSECAVMGTASGNSCLMNIKCESGYSNNGFDTDNGGRVEYVAYDGKPGVAEYTATCKQIGLTTGYNCEENSTRYISCFAGNYMATMDALGNYEYNGTPISDNSCQPCPADAAYCPGGTSAPLYTVTLNDDLDESMVGTLYANVNAEYYKDLVQDEETGNLTATRLEGTLPAEFMPTAPVGKTFNGYWTQSQGGEQYIDANGNFIKGPSADVTLHAQWASNCTPVKVCVADGADNKSCRTVYQRSNDPSMLYGDDVCSDGFSLAWDTIMGTMPNAKDLPVGFYDASTNTECVNNINDNLQITGDCVVDGDATWVVKYQCKDGFAGPDSSEYAWAGEACVENVYTVNITYDCGDFADGTAPEKPSRCFSNVPCTMPSADACGVYPGHTFREWKIELNSGNKITVPADENVQSYINAGETGGSWSVTAQWDPACYTVELKNTEEHYEIFGNDYLYGNGNYYMDTCGGNPLDSDDIDKYTFWMHVIENATFAGYYSENNENSTQCVDENGKWTGDCSVTENTTWYELFKCNDGYTANGEYVDGTNTQCAANVYTVGIVYSCGEYAGGEAPERPKRCSSNDDCPMPSADACGVYPGHTFKEWEIKLKSGNKITVPADENVQSYINAGETGGSWSVTAQWTPIEYDITFDANDGTGSTATQTFTYGVAQNLTANAFTRDGYAFTGWNTASDGSGTAYADKAPISNLLNNITLYAQWSQSTFTIKYYDGATELTNLTPTTYNVTSSTITLPTPTKTGHTFNGWYDNSGLTGTAVTQIATGSTGNKTFWAKWTKDEYTITYNLNGGTNNASNPTKYSVDTATITLANATKTGYTFGGWYSDANFTTKVTQIATGSTGNKTFWVKWTTDAYTITYNLDGGVNAESNPDSYDVTTDTITLADASKTGYTFDGWYNDDNEQITQIIKGSTGNKTLYAKWTQCAAGTYEKNGTCTPCAAGTFSEAGANVCTSCPAGKTTKSTGQASCVACSNNANVDSWNNSGSWNSSTNATVTTCSIKACKNGYQNLSNACSVITYNIKYYDGSTELTNLTPTTYNVTSDTIILAAPSKDGYTFGGWYSDANFTTKVTQIATGSTGNKTFWVKWTTDAYTITYNLDGGVNAESNPDSYDVTTDTITLADASKTGYTFDGWYNDDNEQITQIIKGSTGNKTLYAKWTQCAAGTYEKNGTCTPCAAGTFSAAGANVCTSCPAGKTTKSTGQASCVACSNNANVDSWNNSGSWNSSTNATVTTCSIKACKNGYQNLSNACSVITYNIKYYDGSTELTNLTPTTYNVTSDTITLANPTKTGYTFNGWYDNSGLTGTAVTQIATGSTGNIELTAQWKAMTFTCKSGEYLNVLACEQCPKGYKCPQTQFTYNKNVQGLTACSGATEYQDQEGKTTCKTVSDGYYKKDNTAQTECGNGYYCKNAVRTVCPDNGLTSTTTATDVTDCYKNNQSCTVNGGFGISDVCHYDTTKSGYKNCDVCIINGCSSGYYKDNNTCTICPQGSYCANSDKNACPDNYTTADTGATQQKDCFTTCDDMAVEYGIAHADNAKVSAPAKCTYSRGESVTGNPCDIKDGKCVETSCKYNYEMKGGKCAECVRDNARTFKQGNGNCVVESCEFGYYPDSAGQKCMPATKECTMLSMHAIAAQQTWDTKTNSYTVCQITECADGYHISNNTCISDEQTCNVPNGIGGVQTWNGSKWSECVATKCKPGYTNDRDLMWPAHAKDISIQCGRCDNAFDTNGAEAAHTYVRECEIATCMYQGKKYILENNECRLICNAKDDETGSRYWDSKSEECVHTCNAGYQEW